MFGLHGWPDMPLGCVGTRPGPLLASTDELRVTIRGVQAHAAYPHQGRDPVLAMAHCITALQSVASRSVAPTDSVVVSVCIVNAGTAVNVIPQNASFAATLRCLKATTRELAKRRMSELVTSTALAFDCSAEITWEDGYPVTHNDPALTAKWFELADQALGRDRVVRVENPTMGGEDFSYYARACPSVFFCLGLKPAGAERVPLLHQPDFDFNDAAIPLGVEMFCRLATAGLEL
jgi:amidohydrolase